MRKPVRIHLFIGSNHDPDIGVTRCGIECFKEEDKDDRKAINEVGNVIKVTADASLITCETCKRKHTHV